MNKKLENLIKQLSEGEQKTLVEYIERQYAVEFKGDMMLRDDIVYKVTELLHMEFTQIGWDDIDEQAKLQDLGLNIPDIKRFAEILQKEFKLEKIALPNIMSWVTVGCIVNILENILEEISYASN